MITMISYLCNEFVMTVAVIIVGIILAVHVGKAVVQRVHGADNKKLLSTIVASLAGVMVAILIKTIREIVYIRMMISIGSIGVISTLNIAICAVAIIAMVATVKVAKKVPQRS